MAGFSICLAGEVFRHDLLNMKHVMFTDQICIQSPIEYTDKNKCFLRVYEFGSKADGFVKGCAADLCDGFG